MKKEIKFYPAWNRMDEGYGRHGVDLWFILTGEKATVTFRVFTGWLLKEDRKEVSTKLGTLFPMPTDIAVHSYKRINEDDYHNESCEWRDGEECYTIFQSLLWAEEVFDNFVEKGEDYLWGELESLYYEYFKEDK